MQALQDYINSIYPIRPAAWQAIQPIFEQKELSKGAHFIKVGQYARQIAFLEQGYLRGYYLHKDGSEYNKHFFKPPCFVGGYSSLVTGQPTQIAQQALTDCVMYQAPYAKVMELCEQHADLVWLIKGLAELFLVQKEERELQLVLLDAAQRYEIFQQEFEGLEGLIPQYHIASYLGVSATQLSRIRKKRLE